ncbi:MAG: hypothetical protein KC731_27130, partial [Myxococcales bacterium]|nr:hypothetical protein [Myxococcales bacterium]
FLTPQGAVRLLGLGLTEAYYRALRRGPQPSPEVRLYLPPERWGPKPLTPRANVFSVAAILWRLLSHVPPPAPGEPFPLLRMVRPDLPVRLVSAIDRALERTLLRRRITCIELARVLQTSRLADPAARRWGIGWLNDLVPVALERGPATLPAAAPAPWELRTLPPIDGPDSDVGPSREASLPPAVVPAIPGPAPVPRIADQILDDYDW